MAANKVKTMWTAFLGALVALFAALGFAPKAAATAQVRQPVGPVGPVVPVVPVVPVLPVVPAVSRKRPIRTTQGACVPTQRRALSLDTALPPTIKQRIRAEAHNASPSARRTSADGTGAGDAGLADLQPV